MKSDSELQPAYVLHRRPYANTSLLLELLAHDTGRVACIAKGARQPKSHRAGLLQAFTPLLVAWRGRGEVLTLTNVEAAGNAHALSGERLYCGMYLNELLLALTQRRDPHPELFALYHTALDDLATHEDQDNPLRRFEVAMFRELGYGMPLERERDQGAPVVGGKRYVYVPGEGPVHTTDANQRSVDGATLLALARGELLRGSAVTEARHLMRAVVSHYLEGREIRSRELFKSDQSHE